jgi:hypothetical protein
MGDRGQVRLISKGQPDIYLYTHWTAYRLAETVADALERGQSRWNDDEYLNRIIFCEMVKDEVLDETGYGIGTTLHGDTRLVVEVDHDEQTVTFLERRYGEETDYWQTVSKWSFGNLLIARHSLTGVGV